MASSDRTILIAGCGYLGLEAARLFKEAGWQVCGLTRTPETADEVARSAGIRAVAADLGDIDSLRAAKDALPDCGTVVHAASSSRGGPDAYRSIYINGSTHLCEVFNPMQFLFTSSSSVYGQTNGEIVTESSLTDPGSETSRLLLEAEQGVLQSGGTVARLAGIYGPGRSVILRKFLDGSAVIEDGGSRIVNQIHRDDAAQALFHLLSAAPDPGGIYNVVDDEPTTQRELYGQMARLLALPLPPEGPRPVGRKRGWTSKWVSNAKLRATGWLPRFPSFPEALAHDPRLLASIQRQLEE